LGREREGGGSISRKRSRRTSNVEQPKQIEKPIFQKPKKEIWIAVALIGIFCLVLFMNSYFNYTYGISYDSTGQSIGTRFLLSGPDPYYNMRLCQETLATGHYPFVTSGDPLLNYPVSHLSSARPPLFNMVAVGSTKLLEPFLGTMDALGWSMLLLPAIYGALLVFPVYGIGKELIHKKAGIIAALFIALIPISIGAGHGSAFSLFDHDSFVLLLVTCAIYFLIKSFKIIDQKKSIMYAIFSGISIGAIYMTWTGWQEFTIIFIIYMVIQLVLDVLRNKYNLPAIRNVTIVLLAALFVSLPYFITIMPVDTTPILLFILTAAGLAVFCLYYLLQKYKIPYILTIPLLAAGAGSALTFLYLIHLKIIGAIHPSINYLSVVIFGQAIYGDQVSLTIAEAHTFGLSQTVMSFGPALYWIGIIGFCMFLYSTWKKKIPTYNLFFILIFIINFYLTTRAGRFLNDLVPQMAILAGFCLFIVLEKIDYKSMITNIRHVGIKKGMKVYHVLGILFIALMVIIPNAYCTLDAAVPFEGKTKVFGENYSGAWGNSLGQSWYWAQAMEWFAQQDTNVEPAQRPAIISWWDYGFYIVSMGAHPTVADNFQDGIPPASNFLTSQSEDEAIATLIIRIVEGTKYHFGNGNMSLDTENLFKTYLPVSSGTDNTTIDRGQDIVNILNDPKKYAPSYNQLISPEYGNTQLRTDEWNAMYQDASKIILTLSDDQIVNLYHDIMKLTGKSIRYAALDQRDISGIFNVFVFLADKSTYGYSTSEDNFYKAIYYNKTTGAEYNESQLQNFTEDELRNVGQKVTNKQDYYNTTAIKIYYGPTQDYVNDQKRVPTFTMKHFYPVYLTPYVTIAKFYEGCNVTTSVTINNEMYFGSYVTVLDQYGIPHDGNYVMSDSLNLIAPAGNVSLAVIKDNNFLTMVNFTVTEEQAIREAPSDIFIPITIDPANVNIFVSGVSESSLTLHINRQYMGEVQTVNDLTNGGLTYSNLVPDTYQFTVTNSTGSTIYDNSLFLMPNDNQFNLTIGENQ